MPQPCLTLCQPLTLFQILWTEVQELPRSTPKSPSNTSSAIHTQQHPACTILTRTTCTHLTSYLRPITIIHIPTKWTSRRNDRPSLMMCPRDVILRYRPSALFSHPLPMPHCLRTLVMTGYKPTSMKAEETHGAAKKDSTSTSSISRTARSLIPLNKPRYRSTTATEDC